MSSSNSEQYILQSVSNALSTLDLLARKDSLSVAEISREMHLGKATAFRILTTLEHSGYVIKDEDAHYRLSMKLALMGNVVSGRSELARMAHPYLKELRAQFQETAHLVGWSSSWETVVLDRVIGTSPISFYTTVGFVTTPAHSAASGQVLLAYGEPGRLEKYLSEINWERCVYSNDPPIRDEAALRQLLDQVRQNGYAVNLGDAVPGLYCFAVPVLAPSGHALASLSIAGPESTMKSRKVEMIQALQESASRLQAQFSVGLT